MLKEINKIPACVINNPESVIEVYVDKQNGQVVEKKRLNYNRYKTYTYAVAEYLEMYKHNSLVYNSVLTQLN